MYAVIQQRFPFPANAQAYTACASNGVNAIVGLIS
jgi:hypothetical protein